MQIIFPAIKAKYFDKEYYVSAIKIGLILKLFNTKLNNDYKIDDYKVNEIKNTIFKNIEKPITSSITVFVDNEFKFNSISDNSEIGEIEFNLIENNFYIYEEEELKLALNEALKENELLKDQKITIIFFPVKEIENINNLVIKLQANNELSKIKNEVIIHNNEKISVNPYHEITLKLFNKINYLEKKVDKENNSLSLRSPYLFTLNTIVESNEKLLLSLELKESEIDDLVLDFWIHLFEIFPEWEEYKKASQIREKYIHSSLIALTSIASLANTIIHKYKNNWKTYFYGIEKIDWSKENQDFVNIGVLRNIGGGIISSSESRDKLIKYLKEKLEIEDNKIDPEELSIILQKEYLKKNQNLTFNRRKNLNISIKGNNYIFCYLDFVDSIIIARLKIDPNNTKLNIYKGLWKKSNSINQIGNWGNQIIDMPIVSINRINQYIELLEIARISNSD